MSYIPDCRTHDTYNYKNLNEDNKQFVDGFDWCAEEAVDIFFDNLEEVFSPDSYIGHVLSEPVPEGMRNIYDVEFQFGDRENETREVKTYADLFRQQILDWIEAERDELITSMIDDQYTQELPSEE